MAAASVATSSGVKLAREATVGLTWNTTAGLLLQLDQNTAPVGFSDRRQSQLQPSAPRTALNFWNGPYNLLNVADHAVAFRQCRAGWSPVVQHEATLVHSWQ